MNSNPQRDSQPPPDRKAIARVFWEQAGRDGATYFVSEVIAKGGIYILFVWLATLLPVRDFGLLNVFISMLTMLSAVVGLGLPEGLVRFHFSDADIRSVLGISLTLPWLAALLLVVALIPWHHAVAQMLNVPPELLLFATAGAPLVAMRQAGLNVIRARRESRSYLLLRMLEPVLLVAALLVLLSAQDGLSYRDTGAAYLIAISGAALCGLLIVISRTGLRWSLEPVKPLVLFSVPLVAHILAMTGLTGFDQLVIQQLLGAEESGVYAFAYRFGMAMSLLVFAFGAAWGPFVLHRMQRGDHSSLLPISRMVFRLLLVAAVALAWLVPPIAHWFGGARYAGALPLIPLVVYAYLWAGVYSFGVAFLYYRDRTRNLAMASGAAFVVNAVLNYIAIPVWGITAAAATTVFSYALLSVLLWRALDVDRGELPWREFAFQTVAVMPFVLAASFYYA